MIVRDFLDRRNRGGQEFTHGRNIQTWCARQPRLEDRFEQMRVAALFEHARVGAAQAIHLAELDVHHHDTTAQERDARVWQLSPELGFGLRWREHDLRR